MCLFFTVVARVLASVRICVCSIVAHSNLSVAHQGLQNFSILIPFLGVSQSIHMCHSPSGLDLLNSSGVMAFRPI